MIVSCYLLVFMSSIVLSLLFTRWVRNFATTHGWVAPPGLDRHVHTRSVPRIGGVAIFVSFMGVAGLAMLLPRWTGITVAMPGRAMLSILRAACIIFLLGLYDDVRFVGPYWKFGIQALAAVLLYAGGVGIHPLDLLSSGQALRAVGGLPLTVLWVLLITNAFNLIDGLDGLAAGSAFFSTVVVFVTSLLAPNATTTLLGDRAGWGDSRFLALQFSSRVHFPGRFRQHVHRIHAGGAGARRIRKSADDDCGGDSGGLLFVLPILDVALAVSRRFLSGKPLFCGDRDHIHHKLSKSRLRSAGRCWCSTALRHASLF